MVAAVVPILLITTASADEPKAPVVEATAEAKIPTLTYYYFDGMTALRENFGHRE